MQTQRKRSVACATLVAAFLVGLSAPIAGAQMPPLSVVGPGGGGAMFHPTISPHDYREVLVACDMTGSYITHDAGRSWRMFNLNGPARFFVFDPLNPRTIYVGTSVLWRSDDDAQSWQLVWPRPSAVEGVRMSSDHADQTVLARDNALGTIVALAVDPADSKQLVAATANNGSFALFQSNNRGADWRKITDLPQTSLQLWIDPNSPRRNRDLYVADSAGISARKRGVWSRHITEHHLVEASAGFSRKSGVRIYAATGLEVLVSNDGGATWKTAPLPGTGAHLTSIAAAPLNTDVAYVSYSDLQIAGQSWLGVARTVDGGKSWSLPWQEGAHASPNIHDAWLTAQFDPGWGANPHGLAVAAQDPKLVYGTDDGRTMQSTNGGESWQAVYSRQMPGGGWQSTGLNVTTNYGYLFDPFDLRRQFIPSTDIGLSRSEDGGISWIRSMNGVPAEWSNTNYWLVFDPAVPGKVWGAMSGVHDLPRPKMWRHTSVEQFQGGVCISMDGARTWKLSNAGMPPAAVTHILLDTTSPAGKRVLWATAVGRGVYRSIDDGARWTLKNEGITQQNPLAWRLTRSPDQSLYLVIARRSEDGSIGNAGDGALYRSVDGAETWAPVPLPAGTNGPSGLAIDPANPHRMYLAAWGRSVGNRGQGGGIFLTVDGGSTWKQVLDHDQHVYDITIDPNDPGILYASGFESSTWRSTDRGEHWTRLEGYNFKWSHRVVPDPANPHMIYVSTFGGGVWHGPSQGAPGQTDIATPVLQPAY
jgi:hypothetical protein